MLHRRVLARARAVAAALALGAVLGSGFVALPAAAADDAVEASPAAASPAAVEPTEEATPAASPSSTASSAPASTPPAPEASPAPASRKAAEPTIASDLEDYPPGGTVILTGTGWQPGEIITIVVNETDGRTWSLSRDVPADADGVVTLTFDLPAYYAPNYDVTATGPRSGTAKTTFTDDNVASGPWRYWMSETNPADTTTVTPGTTITYRLNAQKTGSSSAAVTGAVVFFSVSGVGTITGVTGTGGNSGSVSAQTATSLTWTGMNLNRSSNSNQTRYITVTVTVNDGATAAPQSITASVNDANDDRGTAATTGDGSSATHDIPVTVLSCTQGMFYTVMSDGRLYRVSSTGETPSAVTTPTGSSPVWSGTGVNGLAIAPGGTMAYAILRGDDNTVSVLGYDPRFGTGSTIRTGVSLSPLTTSAGMVAGAVNPVDGKYYFGGYQNGSGGPNANRFHVWVFDPAHPNANIVLRGYIVPNGATTLGNSDILFDNQGNLYLSYSLGGVHELVTVTAASLAAGTSGQNNEIVTTPTALPLDAPTQQNTTYNGLAFDSSGRLFTQFTTSGGTNTNTYVNTVDPGSGHALGSTTQLSLSGATGSNSGTDLASCLYPGTVSVQKNLPNGRYATGNQFGLSVSRQGGATQATATTTGNEPGVQPDFAGPAIGVTNAVYTVTETASGTTNSANYTSTYQCVVTGTSTVVASGSGTTLNYTFPAPAGQAAAGPDIMCTFTNVPITPATVTIGKVVQDVNGLNPQPGSGWTVGAVLGTGTTSGTTITTPATQLTAASGSVSSPWSITFPSASATANVTVSETQQTGYVFVSAACTITPRTGTPTVVNLTGVSGNVPGVAPGASVSCVFTNKQQPGTASWQKTDGTTSALLGGSTWSLTGPQVPVNTVVVDCAATPCASGAYVDTNPAPGVFQLAGLAWGTYTIQEQSAPTGYVLNGTVRTFTVSATSLAPVVTGSPFANARILGTVTWQKVDAATPAHYLAGSEWKIVGPSPATTEQAVVDCVAADAAGCTGPDKDHRAGYFSVTGLAWGSYALVETNAPAGYVLNPTPRPFTIAATAVTASVGSITNVQQAAPQLPLTGGIGSDLFTFGGGAALLAAFGILCWRRRHAGTSP